MDLERVDTLDADWRPTKDKSSAVILIQGTEDQRDAVIKIINRNFTNKERELMRGLSIEVSRGENARRGAAGFYQYSGGRLGFDRIVVGRRWLTTSAESQGT